MSVSEVHVREPSSAPARSRADTRRRLLEAGTELFAAQGLHGVTTALVARQAGVATGTFYLHFKDKKELFREIVFSALGGLRERQRRAGAKAGGGGSRSELRARLAELVAFAEENRSLIRVLFGRDHEGADLGESVLDAVLPGIEQRIRNRVAMGHAPGAVHPGVAAQAVTGMTVRAIAWWVEDPSRATREELVETLLEMHPGQGPHDDDA